MTINIAEQLGLDSPENYIYLSQSGTYTVEGTNDVQEFQETIKGFWHNTHFFFLQR